MSGTRGVGRAEPIEYAFVARGKEARHATLTPRRVPQRLGRENVGAQNCNATREIDHDDGELAVEVVEGRLVDELGVGPAAVAPSSS